MDVKEYLEIQDQWYKDHDPKKKEMIQEYNKKLIEEYPFLLPRNRWTDKVSEDYDFTWTEADSLEPGWRLAFGDDLLRELKEELVKSGYLDKYRITQIKEKFSSLRWYDYGCTDKWLHEILPKYEKMSYHTCGRCGAPAKYQSTGWIYPYCEKCAKELYEERVKEGYGNAKFEQCFEEIEGDSEDE